MIRQAAEVRRMRVLAGERRLELTRELHRPSTTLSDRLAQLRREAEACRAQAIILNAKLARLEPQRTELRAVREQLAETSARLDSAVANIATACARRQRAFPRP